LAISSSLKKKPGDLIRSADWNEIVDQLMELKEYVDNMGESVTLTDLQSTEGRAYNLDELVKGETKSYGVKIMGLLTKQWLPAGQGIGDICRFGVTDYFDNFYYWAAAGNGNKNTLDITLEYVDGSEQKVGTSLFVNEKIRISPIEATNAYVEYLYTDDGVWYKYKCRNPRSAQEVRYLKFKNTNQECITRIGNVIHLKSKIRPVEAE
jgi:hypothetical protein